MVQSPELSEAVPGLTVARSAWFSGPGPASGVRLSPWAVPSCRLVRAVRTSRTTGRAGRGPGSRTAGGGARAHREPQRVDLRAGAGVRGAAASLAGVLP